MHSVKVLVIAEGLEEGFVLFLDSMSPLEVIKAADGTEAIAKITEEHVDLVVVSECASAVHQECSLIGTIRGLNDRCWIVVIGNQGDEHSILKIVDEEGADRYLDRSKVSHATIVAHMYADIRRYRETNAARLIQEALV